MGWASLKHHDQVTISCHFTVVFFVHESHCDFSPEFRILFTSGFKYLIMWQQLEYSCLYRCSNELYILEEVVDFISYETGLSCWRCWVGDLVRLLLLCLLSFFPFSLFLSPYITSVSPECYHPCIYSLFLHMYPVHLLVFIEFEILNSLCCFELGIVDLLILL